LKLEIPLAKLLYFQDAMKTAGNASMTYLNVQSLGIKGLVKNTAKDTGKKLLKNTTEKSN
jgi:hypothetical protein